MTAGRVAKSGRSGHTQTGWIRYRAQAGAWSENKLGLEPITKVGANEADRSGGQGTSQGQCKWRSGDKSVQVEFREWSRQAG